MNSFKLILKHLTVLLTVFALSAATAEANQCKDLFFHDPFKGQVISERLNALFWKSTEKMAMSTTGARIEKKWTVETTKLSENLAAFGENLATIGLEIKLRDQKKNGFEKYYRHDLLRKNSS